MRILIYGVLDRMRDWAWNRLSKDQQYGVLLVKRMRDQSIGQCSVCGHVGAVNAHHGGYLCQDVGACGARYHSLNRYHN